MSGDIHIRRSGVAGRITLTRAKALNALTYDMVLSMDAALKDWAADPSVALVIIDAEGDKAFCAGGDIQKLYETGLAGDFAYGRQFWQDEYRMNARLAEYPKPVVSFLQGFVMGGGVGVGCHASHRVVCDSTQIAMPECGIGLVPDVGGSLLLARAPGWLGAYLGLTAARMGPGDAIRAGFADVFIPQNEWSGVISDLETSSDVSALTSRATTAPAAEFAAQAEAIDDAFCNDLAGVVQALEGREDAFSAAALKAIRRNSPLAMATTLALLSRLGDGATIRDALRLEYRVTSRAMQQGDFLEGIRAQIIDKDRNPRWKNALSDVSAAEAEAMLAPAEGGELTFEEERS